MIPYSNEIYAGNIFKLQVIPMENFFLPGSGRVFYFANAGVYKVYIKSNNSQFQCTVYVAETGE